MLLAAVILLILPSPICFWANWSFAWRHSMATWLWQRMRLEITAWAKLTIFCSMKVTILQKTEKVLYFFFGGSIAPPEVALDTNTRRDSRQHCLETHLGKTRFEMHIQRWYEVQNDVCWNDCGLGERFAKNRDSGTKEAQIRPLKCVLLCFRKTDVQSPEIPLEKRAKEELQFTTKVFSVTAHTHTHTTEKSCTNSSTCFQIFAFSRRRQRSALSHKCYSG